MNKELNKATVEQAGGDEREAAIAKFAETCPMTAESAAGGKSYDIELRRYYLLGWDDRAALAQPSQSQYEASFEEWLANELEGEDGHPVPAAVCDIALARRAFNHWPKLEQPAKVGGVRFSAGVSSRLVVEAAQRLYEFESTPEKEAERIERLQAFREQLDPLNLAPHAKAFNEAPAEALKSEQAEAELPEVVAWRYGFSGGIVSDKACLDEWKSGGEYQSLMTVAQHERIVGALRADRDSWAKRWDEAVRYGARIEEQRDAARAKIAELEKREPVAFVQSLPVRGRQPCKPKSDRENGYTLPLYDAPVAQAQHGVPEGWMLVPVEQLLNMMSDKDHDTRIMAERQLLAVLAAAPSKEGL